MRSEKVAIITGASRGIGKEVARGLAEDGYNVVLIARSKNDLVELTDQITQYGVKSKVICADITNFEFISNAIKDVIAEWGQIDVLVNNAGIFIDGSLETSLEDYQTLFDVNFKAQLVLIKSVLPIMQSQHSGHIINIASIAGKVGFSTIGAYTSSKFALVGLSESLHAEYSTQGIKITSICPGYVATDMAKGASIPESAMIQPQDILQTIRWLLLLSPTAFVKEIILNTAR